MQVTYSWDIFDLQRKISVELKLIPPIIKEEAIKTYKNAQLRHYVKDFLLEDDQWYYKHCLGSKSINWQMKFRNTVDHYWGLSQEVSLVFVL